MHRQYGEYDYFEFHYDVENIRIAASCGVTGVMQPFVRSRRDLETVRQALDENGGAISKRSRLPKSGNPGSGAGS